MPYFSIVVPVYGCPESITLLCNKLEQTIVTMGKSYEIILVNDHCPKNSWSEIQKIARLNKKIVGINLSKNFGQHSAITAGLDFCRGEWIVVMDCDLQDQPEEIPLLYKKCQEGYDVVYAKRKERQDSFFKRLGSKVFWRIFDYFTDLDSDESVANFGIYSKRVIKNAQRLREQTRSFPLIIRWLGFKSTKVEVKHNKRHSGKSSYSMLNMLSLATELIIAYSNKPLKLSINLGFILAISSFFYGIYLVINWLFWSSPLEGWTSVMVSLYFLSGLIIMILGIIGIYLGRIFNESKARPLYIIRESLNLELDD
ncbi:MAG: glycosyltransferase family 2 protein [Gammaproteobacteria bacterium]|nr:glycosyltransferase family 2 protein [Gammaproteobacteria bacterium]